MPDGQNKLPSYQHRFSNGQKPSQFIFELLGSTFESEPNLWNYFDKYTMYVVSCLS